MYEPRFYRKALKKNLISFEVTVKETDLYILSNKILYNEAKSSIIKYRNQIEEVIKQDKEFLTTFTAYLKEIDAPQIVKDMIYYTKKVNVGPMASVAGAIAEYVGNELLKHSEEVVVENGGDIFIKVNTPIKIGIFAGKSKFSNKLSILIKPESTPLGVCTSSGTVGHSISLGKSDATLIISKSTIFADAVATYAGNLIQTKEDIKPVIERIKTLSEILGVIIIKDDNIGMWGDIEII
jgi:ApbE superfamily uncharacterized protein (UPF0280 family)